MFCIDKEAKLYNLCRSFTDFMNKNEHRIILQFCFLLIFIFAGMPSRAEHIIYQKLAIDSLKADSDSSDSSDDDTKSDRARYIDVSTEYGSNFTYRNQVGPTPTAAPYLYPSVLYHDKTGLWASFAAYRLITPYKQTQSDGSVTTTPPTWIQGDLSAGWDFKLGKTNDATVSYLYSRFDRNIELVKEAPGNTFEGFFAHNFKWIYTGIRGDYTYENFTGIIHGERVNVPVTDYYTSWETSKEWFIDAVFTHKDYFDINPMFTLLAGTDNFIGKFIVARYPTSKLAAHYAKIASQFLIQEFILDIPVAYNIGNFTATPSFEYTVLTQKVTETSPTSYPIYKFTLAYRFNFK